MSTPARPPQQRPPTSAARPALAPSGAPNAPVARPLALGRLARQARTTLKGQFATLGALLLVLTLGQAALTTTLLRQAERDLITIGRDSTPSVDAAQAMGQYLEDIDAKAADYLGTAAIAEQRPCTVPGRNADAGALTIHECSNRVIATSTALFNNELYKAVRNVTYPGERTALDRIATGFQEYSAALNLMRYEYDQAASKTDPNDPNLRRAHAAYTRASAVLHTKINLQPQPDPIGSAVVDEAAVPDCVLDKTVPAATWTQGSLRLSIDCFSSINKGYLDRTYESALESLGLNLGLGIASGLVLCGMLLFATWRMVALTHRIVNLGLTLALIIGVGQSAIVVARFAEMSGDGAFKALVRDSYDSVYYTNVLKRTSTAANADESRWLVATQFADASGAKQWFADWQDNTKQVQAFIDRAIKNETFPEEREPLSVIQRDWETYTALDPQIRQRANDTANPNRIGDAQQLSTGDSNAAFGRFSATIDRLRSVNQRYFEQTYQRTLAALQTSILLSTVLFPLAGAAALWGITRRLRDF